MPLNTGQGTWLQIMRAMQRHRGSFAIFSKLMMTAFCADQNPARRLQFDDDLFAIHGKFISKKIVFQFICQMPLQRKTLKINISTVFLMD